MAGAGVRVADQQAEGGAVEGLVTGAGEQGECGEAEEFPVGGAGDVCGDQMSVRGGGDAPLGASVVVGPAVDGPADGGGLVRGEGGEEAVGERVGGGDERLAQVVDGERPTGVQQGLGSGGHGGARDGGEGAVVAEPAAEQWLDAPGVGGEQGVDRVERPVVAGFRAGRRVRGHEPPQQIDPLVLPEREAQPERGPEPGEDRVPLGAGPDPVGERPQHGQIGPGVPQPAHALAEQPGGPPGPVARLSALLVGEAVEGLDERGEAGGETCRAALVVEQQEGLEHRADAVTGDGRARFGGGPLPGDAEGGRGRGAGRGGHVGGGGGRRRSAGTGRRRDRGRGLRRGRSTGPRAQQGPERAVQVQMGRLHPVGQFLVGEAVAGARRDEQPFGEDGRGPALPPGEELLEGGPVEDAVPRAETAAGRLVDLAGHACGEPAYGGPRTRGREPAAIRTAVRRHIRSR